MIPQSPNQIYRDTMISEDGIHSQREEYHHCSYRVKEVDSQEDSLNTYPHLLFNNDKENMNYYSIPTPPLILLLEQEDSNVNERIIPLPLSSPSLLPSLPSLKRRLRHRDGTGSNSNDRERFLYIHSHDCEEGRDGDRNDLGCRRVSPVPSFMDDDGGASNNMGYRNNSNCKRIPLIPLLLNNHSITKDELPSFPLPFLEKRKKLLFREDQRSTQKTHESHNHFRFLPTNQ